MGDQRRIRSCAHGAPWKLRPLRPRSPTASIEPQGELEATLRLRIRKPFGQRIEQGVDRASMDRSEAPPDVFSPGRLGPIELRNRAVKCGTNEGMARAGLVTDRLIEWHRAFAAGGVAMSTSS